MSVGLTHSAMTLNFILYSARVGTSTCTICKSCSSQLFPPVTDSDLHSALEYPRCTILPNGETDCGSRAWAFTLFIAWNVLSMVGLMTVCYIATLTMRCALVYLRQPVRWYALSLLACNEIYLMPRLGVVVESFYYVFQMSGGSKSITREEMRNFKKVWAQYANPKTGYLERDQFVPFFGVSVAPRNSQTD